jgi:nicotinamide-nucleotide amidase
MADDTSNDTTDRDTEPATERARRVVREMIRILLDRELTVATAESLTGGLASYLVVDEPESGRVHLGGVVAYASEVKHAVLGVSEGPVVTDRCAREMAAGVQALLGARCALAFTGVAGPAEQEGTAVGTVFVAARVDHRDAVSEHHFEGSPDDIRAQAVEHAAALLCALVTT